MYTSEMINNTRKSFSNTRHIRTTNTGILTKKELSEDTKD